MSKNDSKNKGQIMVETMVALSMVVIAMLGMLSLLSNSIATNKVVSQQYIASYLAAEGIEIVKNILDSNVIAERPSNSGLTGCQNGCAFQYNSVSKESVNGEIIPLKFDETKGIYSYDMGGVPTPFYRIVKITSTDPNRLEVESIVRWESRGGVENEIKLEDRFYNWRQ